MAPMKKPAKSGSNPIQSRCALVKKAVLNAENCPERVQEMLSGTIASTLGQPKATRHSFTDRFVVMIEEIIVAEEQRLQKEQESKDVTFAELTPAKAAREAALEQAKATAVEKVEALDKAKQAVVDGTQGVKDAVAALDASKKAQVAGDKELDAITQKKTSLEVIQKDSFVPLLDGTAAGDAKLVQAVMKAGEEYGFDSSLMATAARVLAIAPGERSGFDATCTEQLKGAFASCVAKFDEELAASAPAKAGRAAAVEGAEAAKQAAETSLADLQTKLAAAKEAKASAEEEKKAAAQSLASFIPDLKKVGDALDAARRALQAFIEGPKAAFHDLKDWKEGDFKAPEPVGSYYETIDGMKCDKAMIDACRAAVEGQGDGRVSVDDAKTVFEKIADGGKETKVERWTLRHCLQAFKWTDAAHDWIIAELKKVPQEDAVETPSKKARTEGGSYYEVIDGVKCDRGIVDACREALGGQGDGRVSVEDARKVWAKATDGNTVTDTEKWTVKYCLSAFNWTEAARDWLLQEFHK